MHAALPLRSRSPSMLTFALATSNIGPLGSAVASISVLACADTTFTPCALTMGGRAVANETLGTLMEIVLRPFAAAAMNSASRSEPGPRSSPFVTAIAALSSALIGAALRDWYQTPMPTNTPSTTSTSADRSARRLTDMVLSALMLQHEHRMPGTFHRSPPEQQVNGR